MYNNVNILPINNDINLNYFLEIIKVDKTILSSAYSYFNDYNINNYITCYLYIEKNKNFEFDEILYNKYHSEYLKYYSRNPNIKILIFTNNIYGYKWCKNFMKFFNVYYIYKQSKYDLTLLDDN